jgi:hypothetical protein
MDNREGFVDPKKKASYKWFSAVFPQFIDDVIANPQKEYTDDELERFEYFKYLVSKLHPVDRLPVPTSKGRRHSRNLMRDAINIYRDIRDNGLRNPLDMWKLSDTQLVLHRGGRRLEIIARLGYETVPCRIFKSRERFIQLSPDRTVKDDSSIHSLGMRQFQKYLDRATDKYWTHGYTQLYDRHIGYLRPTAKKVLEIGVLRGASLLLWKDAFPQAHIYGVDREHRPDFMFDMQDQRITFLHGSQQDERFLKEQVVPRGAFDIIIDDGGHRPLEMKKSFEILWKNVAKGGWYIIEDLYGNYRKGRQQHSIMVVLKDMIDDMNTKCAIDSMHFYYNICFIKKGRM